MNKKNDIWMPLYIGSYIADTMHLTTAQHGAYLLLLMHAWRNDGLLPDDDIQLAQITRATVQEWKSLKNVVVNFFYRKEIMLGASPKQCLSSARLDKERERTVRVMESRKQKASIAAKKRWCKKPKHAPSNAPSNAPSIRGAMLQNAHTQSLTVYGDAADAAASPTQAEEPAAKRERLKAELEEKRKREVIRIPRGGGA